MKKSSKKIVITYMLKGFILGTLFPLIAVAIEILDNKNYSLKDILTAHSNKLLLVIYAAPFILSVMSMLAALKYIKSIGLNHLLKESTRSLLKSKKELFTVSKELEEKNRLLYENSVFDSLTGLKNEKILLDDLALCDTSNIILCVLNIGYFREINTLFGYSVGDSLLKAFAERLEENQFSCYRLHGDEFVIVYYEDADSVEIDTLINYIFDLVCNEEFRIDNNKIFLTINAGVAVLDREKRDVSIKELLQNANFALKYAKDKKIQYALYNDELLANAENIYSYYWKDKILTAIHNNNITAFYQPIINNTTLYPEKYETLIRIKDSEGAYISPYNFMLSSRKYGLYNHLTKLMVIEAFQKIIETNAEISINISISDIRNISTMKLILNNLNSFPKDKTEKIVFELLESEGIENYNEIRDFIKMIKKYNCKIAIDDFGSGYSNFGHIINLDIDYIKIDASIIKNIHNDKNSEYLVKFIVDFAEKVGVKTIAEFVSSKEVFEKVKELGIDYSQGYYFSEPKKDIECFCEIKSD